MDNRSNTIAGWVLGAGIVALGASIVTGEMFHRERPEKMGYPIEGVVVKGEGGAAEAEVPIANLLATADPGKGEQAFKKCTTCHTINKGGPNGQGPNLWGVLGSPIGKHAPGFAYSAALAGKGGTWDWENMNHWVKEPKAFAPGTKMGFAGMSNAQERANLIAFLNTQRDSPLPLPTPQAAPAANPAKAAAEKADQPAAGDKAETEPVMNEQQATPNRVGGEGAPSVAGRAGQEKH
ncbi:MAG TPA: cytochrome c family protein [Allosphingosinicella sp.]|jgi:cytochrome c|nr:cytochrome c family protein [Allosphingosinicella sp.]